MKPWTYLYIMAPQNTNYTENTSCAENWSLVYQKSTDRANQCTVQVVTCIYKYIHTNEQQPILHTHFFIIRAYCAQLAHESVFQRNEW